MEFGCFIGTLHLFYIYQSSKSLIEFINKEPPTKDYGRKWNTVNMGLLSFLRQVLWNAQCAFQGCRESNIGTGREVVLVHEDWDPSLS